MGRREVCNVFFAKVVGVSHVACSLCRPLVEAHNLCHCRGYTTHVVVFFRIVFGCLAFRHLVEERCILSPLNVVQQRFHLYFAVWCYAFVFLYEVGRTCMLYFFNGTCEHLHHGNHVGGCSFHVESSVVAVANDASDGVVARHNDEPFVVFCVVNIERSMGGCGRHVGRQSFRKCHQVCLDVPLEFFRQEILCNALCLRP